MATPVEHPTTRLRAENLRVVAGRELFRGLSLQLSGGEIVALSGPSGSGKTTLLRCLARLRDPDEGTLELDGETPEAIGLPKFRRRVVYVAQRAAMWPGSVADNLSFSFSFATAQAPFRREEAQALFSALGVRVGLDADASRVSEGERQRVNLVRALMVKPEVLLLDEPTSALDAASRGATEELLTERVEAGMAILVVSHDEQQLARLAQRTISLEAHSSEVGRA